MNRIHIAASLLLSSVLASTQASADEIKKTKYVCDDNEVLEVVYVNTSKNSYAVISQVDEMVPMRQMKMASGSNYEAVSKNYTYKLYTKGATAELVEGDDQPVLSNCKSAR